MIRKIRKMLIGLIAIGLLLAVPLTAAATNPYTSVDGDCGGWHVTNFTDIDFTVVHSNDADVPVGALVVADAVTIFMSPFTGENTSLEITLSGGGLVVDEGATRTGLDCEVPPSTTTTTTVITTSTTSTLPPTTSVPPSTTTTTAPGTTTTVTTGPPSTTTTTAPPTTSTVPPSTTTTVPTSSTTSTTVPPTTITIDLEVQCDNTDTVTGKPEQITTWWGGTYTQGSTDEFDVYITIESPLGTFLPPIEPVALPSHGFHDNGPGYRIDGVVRAVAYVDG
ncbi:MAG: hypothetical protein U9N84_06090, partial [Actinomycetota bacterium]|nr:hypothetical protein [Actinomycetota bacterium]